MVKPWWKVWRRKPKTETERRIKAHDPAFNQQFRYADNFIRTSKYTCYNFVPLNLFEQFQRLANFYFLCLLILQCMPYITSLPYITTLIPLVTVLSLTGAKDAIDDFQRHRSDRQVNNRRSRVLRKGVLAEEKWSKVVAGDIILMENNQFIAADVLLLTTSEPNGLCYIETAELDGETNLKSKSCLLETVEMGDDIEALGAFDGEIVCEPPNNNLNKFEGMLILNDEKYSLGKDNVLLRGCCLRNTKWCYGMVIFAGKDTKLMQNTGRTKFKRTSIDRLMNLLILGIVFFLFSMCLFCTIACGVWETVTGQHFRRYLPWEKRIPGGPTTGAAIIASLNFFSYVIILNTVVPISLYVSVEVIRLIHSFWINWDDKMYYRPSNTSARARTTTLNEELGQIEYIFSDKTGTLTKNVMTFNKCSIAGKVYGEVIDEATGEPIDLSDRTPYVDLSDNPMYEPEFRWYDPSLIQAIQHGDADVFAFFRVLALCHTVMSDERDGKLEYQAQSPDEAALVSAARNFGFVFRSRTPNSITIDVMGKPETYELLCILDFNNVRKRMSVILRRNDKITLFCKGADSVIYERLEKIPATDALSATTTGHLNRFAGDGLRTLCLAMKDLSKNEYNSWAEKHYQASIALDDREQKLDDIYEEIETNLTLAGATAIEDKLQDGVPQTIATLAQAGIKIWVLTGDKQETAINIGYSCQLLTDDMYEIFIVDGETYTEVETQMLKFRETIITRVSETSNMMSYNSADAKNQNTMADGYYTKQTSAEEEASGFALIINGFSLVHALNRNMELLFLDVASSCKALICCRVTPLQKAMVVDLVKRHKRAVTLAIGDGANDVSMIKTAHIGVGISGQEGMQAVLSSDFSIAQFRYLERLLLVHGRWSYFRICKFLRYFFYKNFAFTLCNFWFAFFSGFSAQTIFDPFFISCYNVCFTCFPVLAMGILDQDVNDRMSSRYPKLYTPGHLNMLFNKFEFMKCVLFGIVSSFVLFFMTMGAFNNALTSDGMDLSDLQLFGTVIASMLFIAVTSQIAFDTAYWTFYNHLFLWGSVVFYFLAIFVWYSDLVKGQYLGAARMTFKSATFWFTMILTMTILLVPLLAVRFYNTDVKPTLSDRVRLKQRVSRIRSRSSEAVLRTPSARRSRMSVRSGYAFSHQEGFGRLITSGKIMKKLGNITKPTLTNQMTANAIINTTSPTVVEPVLANSEFSSKSVSGRKLGTGGGSTPLSKKSSSNHIV